MGILRTDLLWLEAAANPGKEIDIGRLVVCDACSTDYTDLPDQGGIIFCSMAVCGQCCDDWMPRIISNAEQDMIRGSAAPEQSFADFVRAFRGPDGGKISMGPLPTQETSE